MAAAEALAIGVEPQTNIRISTFRVFHAPGIKYPLPSTPEQIERTDSLEKLLEVTGPDESGFEGLSRNQQVSLLSPPFFGVYRKAAADYLALRRKALELSTPDQTTIAVVIPKEVEKPWVDMVYSWKTRGDVQLSNEEWRFTLKHGDLDLLSVARKRKQTVYESPFSLPGEGGPSSLSRIAHMLYTADGLYLRNTDPVRAWELDYAAAHEDGQMSRYLTRILILQGKASGIDIGVLFQHPF